MIDPKTARPIEAPMTDFIEFLMLSCDFSNPIYVRKNFFTIIQLRRNN